MVLNVELQRSRLDVPFRAFATVPGSVAGCAGEQPLAVGATPVIVSDGSEDSRYGNNMHCWWQITAPTGRSVVLTFREFSLQPPSGSDGQCRDWVRLYDGPTKVATLIGTYCGSTLPPVMVSSGRALTLEFKTDARIVAQGFEAEVVHGMCVVTLAPWWARLSHDGVAR